jgi:hypothetical protein
VNQKPSIGRIVHYTNLGDKDGRYPPEQQAAIITGVYPRSHGDARNADPDGISGEVDLHIFYRTGQFDMQRVPYSEAYERGHWTWPPRA